MKTVFSLLIVVGVIASGVTYYVKYFTVDPPPAFRESGVKQGDLTATINATGTIEPEELVDVGAQVVGRIKEFGKDPSDPQQKRSIDYGSVVKEGTVLALIDDETYRAQKDQSDAALLRAQADLEQSRAKLLQATQDLKRAQQLREANTRLRQTDDSLLVISDSDYDLAVANHAMAQANVGVTQAAVKQAEATLRQAQTNLNYTVIKSPVQGVIIDRRVNVGQTVVSSLSAPSLFLIAKDLRRMQVWASVNEADIGRIHVGMPVSFTVDTYRDDLFRGAVAQIRLNATMTQNVVTYTVVVAFDNSDLRLKPYLTANVRFEVEKRSDVLTVPNMALRWKPRAQLLAPETRSAATVSPGQPQQPRSGAQAADGPTGAGIAVDREKREQLWVRDGSYVRPIDVQIGMTDGFQTEVSGSQLRAGMSVVTGEIRANSDAADTTNPFAPKIFRGKPEQKSPQSSQ